MKYKKVSPPNSGWLEIQLEDKVIKGLNGYIATAQEKRYNKELAGNITRSHLMPDKDDWFFNSTIGPAIVEYEKAFSPHTVVPSILTKNHNYILEKLWCNFQKRYEFNPVHDHKGVFSFVVFMKIPTDFRKEHELPFIKDSNNRLAPSFSFYYMDTLGRHHPHYYHLDKEAEGRMLFFPAALKHTVYPFYTSTKDRITVAGNISLDSDQPLDTK